MPHLFHGINHFKNCLAHCVGFLVCICKRGSFYSIVEFHFRLCTGRSYAYPCIVCKLIVKNIGIRKACRFLLSCSKICDLIQLVVTDSSYFMSCKLCRRILTECCHNLLDLLESLNAFHGNCLDRIFIISKLLIHVDHCIPESLALCLVVSCCLTKCHSCNDSIFISCIGSDQAAVALLKSEQICTLATVFKSKDLLSDVFKSGKYFDEVYTVSLGDRICQVCCNNSLYKSSILRKASVYSLSLAQLIVCEKASGHVSGKVMILAVPVFYTNAKTVCIRVCRKYDVCIYFSGKLQAKFKCLCCLRVRIADCREISIRKFLFRYYVYVLKSKLFKDSSGRDITGSVKRCVNDLEVLALCLDSIHDG